MERVDSFGNLQNFLYIDQMKKLLLISFVLIGCTKSDYCVECSKTNAPTVDMCKSDVPEINIVVHNLDSQGYTCVSRLE